MRVVLFVMNDGSTIPLTDDFPYQKDDIITFKEEPGVAYKVMDRQINTSKNISSSLLVDGEPDIPVTVILKAQRGKMVLQQV